MDSVLEHMRDVENASRVLLNTILGGTGQDRYVNPAIQRSLDRALEYMNDFRVVYNACQGRPSREIVLEYLRHMNRFQTSNSI